MKNIIAIFLFALISNQSLGSDSSTEEMIPQDKEKLFFDVGLFSRQNERDQDPYPNQDRLIIQSLKYAFPQPRNDSAVFGIFDGHGGHDVAEFLANNFAVALTGVINSSNKISMIRSIKKTYINLDMLTRSLNHKQGSTAVTAIVYDNILYLAHAGDSEALAVFKSGKRYRYHRTLPHKPDAPNELKRIGKAGGRVVPPKKAGEVARLEGGLSISRSIGDHPKEAGLIAKPQVLELKLDDSYKFLILVSDGVTDVLGSEEIIKLVLRSFAKNQDPQSIAQLLVEQAKHKGSLDDISAIVVRFIWANKRPAGIKKLNNLFSEPNAKKREQETSAKGPKLGQIDS